MMTEETVSGTRMSDATLNDVIFPVKMEKNQFPSPSGISNFVWANINGKSHILNACGGSYHLFSNAELYGMFEIYMNYLGINFEVEYQMSADYSKVSAKFILLDEKYQLTLGNGDKVSVCIYADRSFDSLSPIALRIGLYRFICSNGLVSPYREGNVNLEILGKHVGSVASKITKLLGNLEMYLDEILPQVKETFEVMCDTMIPEYEERVVAVITATDIKANEDQFKVIIDTIEAEANALYGGEVNEFLIYNGINAHIFGATKSNGKELLTSNEIKVGRDQKVLAYMLN
jgi:hypothetical protein